MKRPFHVGRKERSKAQQGEQIETREQNRAYLGTAVCDGNRVIRELRAVGRPGGHPPICVKRFQMPLFCEENVTV